MRSSFSSRSLALMQSTAVLVVAGALMSMPATAADAWLEALEPRVLKLADFSGDQNANFGAAMVAWEEAITEFTEGKITFENYWSASLLTATDTLPGIRDGVADIGLIIPTYYPQELPVGSWLFGLGGALSGSTVHDVAAGGAAALETVLTLDALTEEYSSHNIKVLQGTSTPAYNLLCNKPISSLEDAKGIRARAIGAVWSDTAEALGMTPVAIAWNEAYEGLQRNVFDCMVINPNQYVNGLILKDVAQEFVPVTMAQLQSSTWVMNEEVWDSLPVELQNFMTEQSVKAAYAIWMGYLEIEAGAGDLIAAADVIHTNDVSELEPVAAKQRAESVAALASVAPASITEPQAVIDNYLARIAYWTDALEAEGYPVAERTPEAILEAFGGLRDVDLSKYFAKVEAELTPMFLN